MTWPWVVLIGLVLASMLALVFIGHWFTQKRAELQATQEVMMNGPRPVWMQQPPRSLEEAVQMLEEQQKREEGSSDE